LRRRVYFIEAYLIRSYGSDEVAGDNDEDDEEHLPGAQATNGTSHKGTQVIYTS
jgi:hypothetical protein